MLFLTSLACHSLLGKLRFSSTWIQQSAVTFWYSHSKVGDYKDLVVEFVQPNMTDITVTVTVTVYLF